MGQQTPGKDLALFFFVLRPKLFFIFISKSKPREKKKVGKKKAND